MFDFANSSFTTVMVTTYFSIYFQNTLVPPDADGSTGHGTFLWGVCLSVSQAIVILTAPLLGALADFSGAKKKFLFVTYLGCSLLTVALGFVPAGMILPAMTLFIVANIFFSSGENIVSAFLPEIAPKEMIGRISGAAWGFGATNRVPAPPLPGELAALRQRVGYRLLEIDPASRSVVKRHPETVCDLSAVAKGYAVDRLNRESSDSGS